MAEKTTYEEQLERRIRKFKKLVKILKEREAGFQKILDASPAVVLITRTRDGRYMEVNQAYERISGYSPKETVGKSTGDLSIFVDPADRERGLRMLEEADQIDGLEYKARNKDGSITTRLLSARKLNYLGEDCIISVILDITERKKAEEELAIYRENLEKLVEERTRELNRTVEELRRRNEENQMLTELSDMLQACDTEGESYSILAFTCDKLFAGHSGFLGIMNDLGDQIEAKVGFGGYDCSNLIIAPGDCWSLRRGGAHLVLDTSTGLTCRHFEEQTTSSLCIPIVARSNFIGLIHLAVDLEEVDSDFREKALEGLAGRVSRIADLYALSLANIRLREKLRRQSILDPLTGLYNRRHMEQALKREIARAGRKKSSIGLMMIDVDHFKEFNDNHGHEAGDEVLRQIGRFLNRQSRKEDIACRYGGEEMLMILPDCNLEDCLSRSRDILAGIKDLQISYGEKSLQVTVSIGIGSYPENGEEPEDIFRAADAALYRAKTEGRDRVIAAQVSVKP